MAKYKITGIATSNRAIVFNAGELVAYVQGLKSGKYTYLSSDKTCFKKGSGHKFDDNVLKVYYRNTYGSIVLYDTTIYDAWGQVDGYETIYRSYERALAIGHQTDPYLKIEWDVENSVIINTDCFMEFNVTPVSPIINDITLTRNTNDYTAIINATNVDKYKIEIYNASDYEAPQLVKTYESVNNTILFPISILQNGVNRITVTAYNLDVTTIQIKDFNHYTPTVTDFIINSTNNLIDDNISLSWKSTYQTKVELFNNNKLIKTMIGTITSTVLPKGTLSVGNNLLKLVVYGQGDSGVVNSIAKVDTSSSITLGRIEPSIEADSLSINNVNIDKVSIISWKSTNQTRYQVFQDNTILASGTTAKSATISEGTLYNKDSSIKLVVFYDSGFDTISKEATITIKPTQDNPIIYNLEPSNLKIDVDNQVLVSFETNEFCDSWELATSGTTTTGTTDRQVTYGKNVFSNGLNTIILTTYYTPKYSGAGRRVARKEVTFTGYGTPNKPNVTYQDVYSNATPLISWDAVNQRKYKVIVHKIVGTNLQEIINTGEVISTETQYQFALALEDKTSYKFSISYQDEYKWSAFSEIQFSTLFTDIVLPDFQLFEMDGAVQITTSGYQDANFKTLSIFRKIGYDFVEIANNLNTEDSVTDFTCPSNTNVEYKLRVFDTNNGYKDTVAKTIKIKLINYHLTNIENAEQSYRLDFVELTQHFNSVMVSKLYAGLKAPRAYKGTTNYRTLTIKAQMENNEVTTFINFINNANDFNLFCFRDWKGNKLFVVLDVSAIENVNSFIQNVTITATEVSFVENNMYTGSGFRKIVYLDGSYTLNGGLDLSGYDDNYILEVEHD